MGFPTVYDMTILNEHPFLLIFGPEINFWVEEEVGGLDLFFFFFELLKSPLHGLSNGI